MRDKTFSNSQLLELIKTDQNFKSAKDNILRTDTISIDTISMILAVVLNHFECVCCGVRCNQHVFGGMQINLYENFRQLKPGSSPQYMDVGNVVLKV